METETTPRSPEEALTARNRMLYWVDDEGRGHISTNTDLNCLSEALELRLTVLVKFLLPEILAMLDDINRLTCGGGPASPEVIQMGKLFLEELNQAISAGKSDESENDE